MLLKKQKENKYGRSTGNSLGTVSVGLSTA